MGVNKVILVGRLGKDPELRYTAGNIAVGNFSVAASERRKDSSGNWTEHTEWHNIVVFGKVAESCHTYIKKGREVYIEGRIQTKKWQDKEGKDRYTTEIIANSVQFLGGGQGAGKGSQSSQVEVSHEAGGDQPSPSSGGEGVGAPPQGGSEEVSFDDDDIPF